MRSRRPIAGGRPPRRGLRPHPERFSEPDGRVRALLGLLDHRPALHGVAPGRRISLSGEPGRLSFGSRQQGRDERTWAALLLRPPDELANVPEPAGRVARRVHDVGRPASFPGGVGAVAAAPMAAQRSIGNGIRRSVPAYRERRLDADDDRVEPTVGAGQLDGRELVVAAGHGGLGPEVVQQQMGMIEPSLRDIGAGHRQRGRRDGVRDPVAGDALPCHRLDSVIAAQLEAGIGDAAAKLRPAARLPTISDGARQAVLGGSCRVAEPTVCPQRETPVDIRHDRSQSLVDRATRVHRSVDIGRRPDDPAEVGERVRRGRRRCRPGRNDRRAASLVAADFLEQPERTRGVGQSTSRWIARASEARTPATGWRAACSTSA